MYSYSAKKRHNTFLFFATVLLSLFFSSSSIAQRNYDIYWVQFKHKQGTPYSIFHPQEYLSARALERRAKHGILIDSTDLPINPKFLEPILVKGFKIHSRSNWLNGVAIITEAASNSAEDLLSFDFVEKVFPIGFKRAVQAVPEEIGQREYMQNYRKKSYYYGTGKNQIQMLQGQYLHKMGFEGQGMQIAILDGGFEGMPETPAFDSLFVNGQILGTHDFVEGDDYVYESSNHGRNVASCMAANLPYLFVGTAPRAEYYLFKTEDVKGEYLVEEYNWIAAVEESDRLGVDVVNSSLGYYDFDDNNMDYAYVDLDGKTSAMTRVANLAARKGMLVVTSAGNEGSGKWKRITVPADADSVLTVAAVDRDGYHARFSSYGFPNKTNIKPNVAARGAVAVVAAKKRYDTSFSNGTSFSAPIMAGMATSFWQAFPEYSNMDVINNLQQAGSQINEPDTALGYGIPDFRAAYQRAKQSFIELDLKGSTQTYFIHENQAVDLFISDLKSYETVVEVRNQYDQLLFEETQTFDKSSRGQLWHQQVSNWEELPAGSYFVTVKVDGVAKHLHLIKSMPTAQNWNSIRP